MPADATLIIAAVKTALTTAFPAGTNIQTSKREATSGKPLEGGWSPGYPDSCLVVSMNSSEEIDRVGTFEHISVGYTVLVEIIKPAQGVVKNAVDTGPAAVIEDPAIRDQRALIRKTLYVSPFPGFTAASGTPGFHVSMKSRRPYEQTGAGSGVFIVSGEEFTIITTEVRP